MAFVERLAVIVEANASKAIAEFRQVGQAAATMGTKVATAGGKGGLIGKLGLSPDAISSGLAALKVGVAGAVAAGAAKSVAAYQDLAQSVLAFQRVSGATAEQSSQLIAAFDDMGISAETGAKSIFNLGRRLLTSQATLAAFGVTVKKDQAGNTDLAATLLNVADAYQATNDPARRAALLTAAFGKAGRDMIPILEKGRAGIEAMFGDAAQQGQILDQGDLKRSEDFRLAIDDMQDTIGELALVIGEGLVPVLTQMLSALSTGAEKAGGVIGWVRHQLDNITPDFIPTDWSGIFGTDEAEEAGEAVNGLGVALRSLGGIARGVAAVEEEALDDLEDALFSAAAAHRGLEVAQRGLVTANHDAAEAQDELNILLAQGAVDVEAVADAQRSLESATRSVGSAQREQAKAQAAYASALANANDLKGYDTAQEALVEAADNLADANDNVTDAQDRAKEAQDDLRAAQLGDADYQQKVADAREKVADANQRVSDVQLSLAEKTLASSRAQEAQNQALLDGAGKVGALEDKLRTLIALQPELAPLLSIPLATLNAINTTSAPTSTVGQGLLGSPLLGGGAGLSPLIFPSGGGGQGTAVTVNQTFNTPVDPQQVAHAISWTL